jgi:hypothetical protein
MAKPKKVSKDISYKNLNVRFPEEDYETLKKIADELGGISLSNLVRMLICPQIEKYKKSGNANDFLKK